MLGVSVANSALLTLRCVRPAARILTDLMTADGKDHKTVATDRPTQAEALAALPQAIQAVRVARRLSLRDAADEMGVSFNTLHRLEKGGNCTLANVVAAVRWLEGGR